MTDTNMIQHSIKMESVFNIINNSWKWEDYVKEQQEDGDATLEEIYTVFGWGNCKCNYGGWRMMMVRDAEAAADDEDDE